jgi:hypothetical protein
MFSSCACRQCIGCMTESGAVEVLHRGTVSGHLSTAGSSKGLKPAICARKSMLCVSPWKSKVTTPEFGLCESSKPATCGIPDKSETRSMMFRADEHVNRPTRVARPQKRRRIQRRRSCSGHETSEYPFGDPILTAERVSGKRVPLNTQVRSKRSRVITFVHAFTKSRTNFSCPSEEA